MANDPSKTAPTGGEALMQGESPPVEVLKALAHPVRLHILEVLADKETFGLQEDGCCARQEVCVCKLNDLFDISAPTLSHHLKLLREAGLVEGRREGVWIYYSILPGPLARLAALLRSLEPKGE